MKQLSSRIDPSPVPVAVTHSWYMDEDIPESQPHRYNMNFARIKTWERVKEQSQMEKWRTSGSTKAMTQESATRALTTAVQDMNVWLFKGEAGDHPNNVFTNYLKKALQKELGNLKVLDNDSRKGIKPNNVLVHIENKIVRDLHFYDTSWPDWANELLKKLRVAASTINYKTIGGTTAPTNTITTLVSSPLDSLVNDIASFKFS